MAFLKPATYVPTGTSTKTNNNNHNKTGQGQRLDIPSMCETEFEEDSSDWVSTYSGEEDNCAEAHVSPVMQFPPVFPSRQSIMNNKKNTTSTNGGGSGSFFERGALESAIVDSMPDENTATALDKWLQSQKSTTSLTRKNGRLNVVQEEVDE